MDDQPAPVVTSDPRLTRMLARDAEQHATLSDYAHGAGRSVEEILDLLSGYLDRGALALEFAGDDACVHTAPHGRPAPPPLPQAPANLWELLRRDADPTAAFRGLQLLRQLERGGVVVVARPERHVPALARAAPTPRFAAATRAGLAPLLEFPDLDRLADPRGPLSVAVVAGLGQIGVLCRYGDLDAAVTAARRWRRSHRWAPPTVVVFEAPRFQPTVVGDRDDAAVAPRAVARQLVEHHTWGAR